MRLGQLARKISIRQSDMVDFLVKSGVSIANESNARLEDEHVQSIIQHFAPSFLEEAMVAAEPIISDETIEQPAMTLVVAEEVKTEQIEISVSQTEVPEPKPQIEEIIEVIKAPKVDLPGLKVLGKIELPEPKKKEGPVEETENVAVPVSDVDTNPKPRATPRSRSAQDNDRQDKNRERSNRSSVNPIALQREREGRAAEEKRRTDAIKEKEKRTEYYFNRVKTNAPTKAARIYAEPVEEFTTTPEKEPPKTWLGKFFRWLTTA